MSNPLATVARMFLPQPDDFQMRSIELAASFDDQINVLTRQRQGPAWRIASVNEALGVPAIWGAVSLIADTVGSLSLEAFRQGVLLAPEDRPRLIIRPNPFSTPRDFFRDTAFYLASRGESWWWVAARDQDGVALSLYPVPPWEITVEVNQKNRLRPIIKWADREMPNEDMRQITYMPDGLRGKGPLQACGAAISVSVESQTWAANFFGSNIPSLIGETEQDMDENEMKLLKQQWLETEEPNTPRFVTNGLTLKTLDINPEQAQLTESRQHAVGDAARMFSMPGSLIEYQMGGSSLTYQNQDGIWSDFQRRCLSPHYLEPVEQAMGDLLTRATSPRFNLKQLLRSDAKTRMEVHALAITNGIYSAEVAAAEEGYAPGSVDYAPVPLALPQAIPSSLPIQLRSQDGFRCSGCNRKLAESAGSGTVIRCRCGELNEGVSAQSDDLQLRALMAIASREPSVVNNYPAPVNVTIERGAVQVDPAPPAEVNVTTPDVHVEVSAPDMSEVAGAIAAIAERPQPEIRVDAPVTVEAPQVTVNVPEPRGDIKTLSHDKDGRITEIVTKPN